jgi:lipid-A-disaccharide synthase
LVVLLPGSRQGEFRRHFPYVIEATEQIYRSRAVSFVWAVPEGADVTSFRERISGPPIQIVEGETWDAIAHADVALAASGTVTVEAAILGTPMVTYYRVMPLSWLAGRFLVRVPFYTMVNLIAGRKIVPELIQQKLTGSRLAEEALDLLDDSRRREKMRDDLRQMVATLDLSGADPMERAAAIVSEHLTMRSGVCPSA